jgi:hypothetical protein
MSFYHQGLSAHAAWDHEIVEPVVAHVVELRDGVSLIKKGGSRMHQVGAPQEQAEVAPTISGVVEWVSDVGLAMLLLVGIVSVVATLRNRET